MLLNLTSYNISFSRNRSIILHEEVNYEYIRNFAKLQPRATTVRTVPAIVDDIAAFHSAL
jgi:hypothetical protein